jgi:hypothetical protein
MQEDDKPLSERESLELITRMINKAKCDYEETGISSLMWGSIIALCSIVSFIGNEINMPQLDLIWYLTIFAVVFQIVISIREHRKKSYTSYSEDALGGIWIGYGISIFLFSFYSNRFQVTHTNTIFLIAYGVPTFATGFAREFKPMIIGSIACWVMAIASMFTPPSYSAYNVLFNAPAAILAWFIPGLILRRRYLNAKRGNV